MILTVFTVDFLLAGTLETATCVPAIGITAEFGGRWVAFCAGFLGAGFSFLFVADYFGVDRNSLLINHDSADHLGGIFFHIAGYHLYKSVELSAEG